MACSVCIYSKYTAMNIRVCVSLRHAEVMIYGMFGLSIQKSTVVNIHVCVCIYSFSGLRKNRGIILHVRGAQPFRKK